MTFRLFAFLLCSSLVFAGCSSNLNDLEGRARSVFVQQYCGIAYSAVLQMRQMRQLSDPDMVASCPSINDVPLLDINPRPKIGQPKSRWTQAYIEHMLGRAFPQAIVDQIATSAAFAELIAMRVALAGPNPSSSLRRMVTTKETHDPEGSDSKSGSLNLSGSSGGLSVGSSSSTVDGGHGTTGTLGGPVSLGTSNTFILPDTDSVYK